LDKSYRVADLEIELSWSAREVPSAPVDFTEFSAERPLRVKGGVIERERVRRDHVPSNRSFGFKFKLENLVIPRGFESESGEFLTQGFSLQKSVEMYSIKEIPWNGEAAGFIRVPRSKMRPFSTSRGFIDAYLI
jgi:hypothetical protein